LGRQDDIPLRRESQQLFDAVIVIVLRGLACLATKLAFSGIVALPARRNLKLFVRARNT
jgi:hypothetical protein